MVTFERAAPVRVKDIIILLMMLMNRAGDDYAASLLINIAAMMRR